VLTAKAAGKWQHLWAAFPCLTSKAWVGAAGVAFLSKLLPLTPTTTTACFVPYASRHRVNPAAGQAATAGAAFLKASHAALRCWRNSRCCACREVSSASLLLSWGCCEQAWCDGALGCAERRSVLRYRDWLVLPFQPCLAWRGGSWWGWPSLR